MRDADVRAALRHQAQNVALPGGQVCKRIASALRTHQFLD
jgi:hypothetical protein